MASAAFSFIVGLGATGEVYVIKVELEVKPTDTPSFVVAVMLFPADIVIAKLIL